MVATMKGILKVIKMNTTMTSTMTKARQLLASMARVPAVLVVEDTTLRKTQRRLVISP